MKTRTQSFGFRMVRAIRRFSEQQRQQQHADSLRHLDRRALADIGIDASEFGSIDAEAHGRSALTRRRIVLELDHA